MNYQKLTIVQKDQICHSFAVAFEEENSTSDYDFIYGQFDFKTPDDFGYGINDEEEELIGHERVKEMFIEYWNINLLIAWMRGFNEFENLIKENHHVFGWCKEQLDELPDNFSEEEFGDVIEEILSSVWG